jgi:hypothetical protein
MTPVTLDVVNGTFELCGAVFMSRDAYKLYGDKQIKGVHWFSRFFFLSWGLWNVRYYPGLDQWVSFCGGIALALANVAWCSLALKYRKA